MKNITFSADEHLIAAAREAARRRHTTLNQLFRQWLEDLHAQAGHGKSFDRLMSRLETRVSGGPFSREEMNAR